MNFRVLWDQVEGCPYREGQLARLPLRAPGRPLEPAEFDHCLEEGDRRSGRLLYRTECPACRACQPLRVPVTRFQPTRSQRRALAKNADVTLSFGAPVVSRDRLDLYNRHKHERGLSREPALLDATGYRTWLVDSCVDSQEILYRVGGRTIGVSILDLGATSASSVYHYFDPGEGRRSLGVFSVLKEIELAKQLGKTWYYLGYYVEDCRHLRYKAHYVPHQRKVGGEWVDVEALPDGGGDKGPLP